MKIKLTFIIKQPQIYTTRTTLSTKKNKRNFSTIASRVRASPRRRHCRCRIPGQQERKDRRLVRNLSGYHHQTAAVVTTARYCCCRRNSYADVTNGTVTTPLVDHRSVPPAHSRSPPFPEPRNAFHMR